MEYKLISRLNPPSSHTLTKNGSHGGLNNAGALNLPLHSRQATSSQTDNTHYYKKAITHVVNLLLESLRACSQEAHQQRRQPSAPHTKPSPLK